MPYARCSTTLGHKRPLAAAATPSDSASATTATAAAAASSDFLSSSSTTSTSSHLLVDSLSSSIGNKPQSVSAAAVIYPSSIDPSLAGVTADALQQQLQARSCLLGNGGGASLLPIGQLDQASQALCYSQQHQNLLLNGLVLYQQPQPNIATQSTALYEEAAKRIRLSNSAALFPSASPNRLSAVANCGGLFGISSTSAIAVQDPQSYLQALQLTANILQAQQQQQTAQRVSMSSSAYQQQLAAAAALAATAQQPYGGSSLTSIPLGTLSGFPYPSIHHSSTPSASSLAAVNNGNVGVNTGQQSLRQAPEVVREGLVTTKIPQSKPNS